MRLLNWLRSLLLQFEASQMERKILHTLQDNSHPIPEPRSPSE